MSGQVKEGFKEWCIVELMGHRKVAGLVTEFVLAGKGFVRVDIPGSEGRTVSPLYSPDALYGLTPTTEEVCRTFSAAGGNSAPLSHWELRLPALPALPERSSAAVTEDDEPRF